MRLIDADNLEKNVIDIMGGHIAESEVFRSIIDREPTIEEKVNSGWIPIHTDADYPKTKGYYFITRENETTDYCYWQKSYKGCWKSMGIIAYMEKPQKYEVTL